MADDLFRLRKRLNDQPGERDGCRTPLPEDVAAYVRELILSGEVRPGDFLRMARIAEAVGVSNTPVREGLLSLRSGGFVYLVPRRGFVVASFSAQDVRDLFWVRAQLAAELAARTAAKATAEQLARLEAIDTEYKRAMDRADPIAVAELGHRFHRELNMAAESHRLALLLGSIVRHLPNRFYADIEGHASSSRNDHADLLEALRARDTTAARSVTERHILDGADGVVAMLRDRGMWALGSVS
jgi:DNA-binding GntR family transcriptional regulator